MKKNPLILTLIFLLTIAAFQSCTKDSVAPSSTDDDTTEVLDLLALTSGKSNDSSKQGCNKNFTDIDIDSLPASITNYLDSAYVGHTITKAFSDDDGVTYVVITTADGKTLIIEFDSNGNFVEVHQKPVGGCGNSIDSSDLPTAITGYIDSAYTGASIEKAFQKGNGDYVVLILLPDNTYVGLVFDSNGVFIKSITAADKKGGKKGKGHGNGKGKNKGKGNGKNRKP